MNAPTRSGRTSRCTRSTTRSHSPCSSARRRRTQSAQNRLPHLAQSRAMKLRLCLAVASSTALIAAVPSIASAQDEGGAAQRQAAPAKISVKINGLKGGQAKVGDKVEAVATITPFVPHQRVEIRLGNGGDTVAKRTPYVRQVKGKKFGRVKLESK